MEKALKKSRENEQVHATKMASCARVRRLYYDRPGYARGNDDDDDDERTEQAGMEAAKQEDGDNCARQCTRLLPLFRPKACNCKCQATHFAVRTHDTFGRSRRASRNADAMRSAFALPHSASVCAFITCMNACICYMCMFWVWMVRGVYVCTRERGSYTRIFVRNNDQDSLEI